MNGKKMTGFPTREQALDSLFAVWKPEVKTELVPLDEAVGRVTAAELRSLNTLPVCRVSGGDGIAVKSALFAGGMPDYRRWRCGTDFVRADTGDDFPDEFDAVIMIEEVTLAPDGSILSLSADVTVKPGENVTPAGSTVKKGDLLLAPGRPIRPTDLAALAVGGQRMIPVRKKPRVAFLPTGTELVPPSVSPARGQNVDANSLLVRETLRALGAEPLVFPITPDDRGALAGALDDALEAADIVVVNGGTSKGSEDFNSPLLESRGQLLCHYVQAAPGRPLAIALIGGKPVINLPGPTVAAFYGADWCLAPIVCRALGVPAPVRETVECVLQSDLSTSPAMAMLCRLEVKKGPAGYVARPLAFHRASLPLCLASNGMYVSPVGEGVRRAGETIAVELLRGREYIFPDERA